MQTVRTTWALGLAAVVCLTAAPASAGNWSQQPSPGPGYDYHDIHFADPSNGCLVAGDQAYAEQKTPSLAVDASGNMYLAWQDIRDGDYDIYFSRSTDGGVTWSAHQRLNDDLTTESSFPIPFPIPFSTGGKTFLQCIFDALAPANVKVVIINEGDI